MGRSGRRKSRRDGWYVLRGTSEIVQQHAALDRPEALDVNAQMERDVERKVYVG